MALQDLFQTIEKGGPGSGHKGHAGIPGHRGGSAPKTSALPSPSEESIETQGENISLEELSKKYPKVTSIFGTSLVIQSNILTPNIQNHLSELEKIPPNLLKDVKDAGVKIYIGDGGMPTLDDLQGYAGVRPRGWMSGDTWDNVAGAYDIRKKVLALGKGIGGSVSGSVTLHEFGHALDFSRGEISTTDENFSKNYRKLYREKKLSSYEKQGGKEAGKQEAFAECFSLYITNKETLREMRGSKIVEFFDMEASSRKIERVPVVKPKKKITDYGDWGSTSSRSPRNLQELLDLTRKR